MAVPGSRERHYRADDVERFRAQPRRRAWRAPRIPVIDLAIRLIEGGRFFYRGYDAIRLAETAALEDVADIPSTVSDGSALTPTLPSPRSRIQSPN